MTLLFKIHYFLWYGAHTAIFGYESVFAQQYTNASTVQYGTLKMILPFIAVIVTPIVCSRADRKRSHRLYFTLALLLSTITIFGFTFLPLTMRARDDYIERPSSSSDQRSNPTTSAHGRVQNYVWFGTNLSRATTTTTSFETNVEHEQRGQLIRFQQQQKEQETPITGRPLWLGPWIFFCINTLLFELSLAVTSCLSDSFAVLQAEESGTSFGNIILWGTFGWAVSALVLGYVNQIKSMPRLLPGILLSAALLLFDFLIVVFWPNSNDFKLDAIPIDAARSLTGSSSSGHREPSDYQPSNEANLINLGTELVPGAGSNNPGENNNNNKVRKRKVKSPVELLAERANERGQTNATSSEPRDDAVMAQNKSLNPYTAGSNGRNSLVTVIESERPREADNSDKRSGRQPGQAPAEVRDQKQPLETTSFGIQFKLFMLILCRRRVLIRFLVLFVLSGFFISMQWNYFFLYLEQTFTSDFTLVSALSMVAQSLLGELPFFILSRVFIAKLGRSHTLSVSLITMGLRFLIYRFLLVQVSLWCIFLADCLQGPNYGLFYVVMTEVGLEYSFCDNETIARLARSGLIDGRDKRQVDAIRLALRSTVQSVAFACYEGLGVGLGSLVGGLLLAQHDFNLLWLSMALGSISVGLINILIELLCRERDPED